MTTSPPNIIPYRALRQLTLGMILVSLLMFVIAPSISYASKEGVFINDSVYFTLEEVTLSSGADNQIMDFTIKLNNDSDSWIDYNRFGVRVTSVGGGRYYAQLSHAGEGLVAPHSSANYVYVARIPSNQSADQLQVTIFEWGQGGTSDVGSLSVVNVETLQYNQNQMLINMLDVDATVQRDTFVTFQAVKAFAVPEDGKWKLTVNVAVEHSGNEHVTLPQVLKFYVRDDAGRTYGTTAALTEGTTLAAGKRSHLIVTATMDSRPSGNNLQFQVSRNDSHNVLSKINLTSLLSLAQVGDSVPYVMDNTDKLSLRVQEAQVQKRLDDKQALVKVVFQNDTERTVEVPNFIGTLVSPTNLIAVNASTAILPESYVASGKTAAYVFAANLPDGVEPNELQFLLSEKQAANAVPIMAASLSGMITTDNVNSNVANYTLGDPISIDPSLNVINENLEVSLVDLRAHVNTDNNYQSVVAKIKFNNSSSESLPLPAFVPQLVDSTGAVYPGARQTTTVQQLIPSTSYVFSYTFLLPPSLEGPYTMQVMNNADAAQYNVPLASYRVAVLPSEDEILNPANRVFSFYPFQVHLQDWSLSYEASGSSYTYKLKIRTDIQQTDQAIVDENLSSMEFELVDAFDRILGTTSMKFVGTDKLTSGERSITYASVRSEQYDDPVSINVYETIQSPTGTVKRLVAKLKK